MFVPSLISTWPMRFDPAGRAFTLTVPFTGCVTPEPSTLRAVMDAMPWTVMTSAEAKPAVPRAGCFADVDAPAGNGSDAAEVAWVAGKFEIDTGTADALNCASVKGPVTAWLDGKLFTDTGAAKETGTVPRTFTFKFPLESVAMRWTFVPSNPPI